MLLSDFDYTLPEELIAQYPSSKRDEARLLVVDRENDTTYDRHFYDILEYLKPGDCLVMNDSKVIPARLHGEKRGTGGKVEVLLTKRIDSSETHERWEAMVRPGKRLKPGASIVFSDEPGRRLSADIVDYSEDGTRILDFSFDGTFHDRLEEIGNIPLPPYIEREVEELDKVMYQTVYARDEGSVAAPTAGLHFTDELLDKVRKMGVRIAYVTLNVGIGTFRPVKTETVEEHHMHFEEYEIDEQNAAIINDTKARGGRIISVGTTSTRTLESAADENGRIGARHGNTDIFIYPGYNFKIVDCLITNFHLPKSTLLMLISALYDREKIIKIYEGAVEKKYRFFSYGDAMFIE
ncbi:MAG: tRNA preQ1(34) S-adenosylmethionine ribosyltransferase-isomerase QueA [Clostridia bacterium]|nr:tRNA preQ1(34) S-adenosylmethionine ribosyltransferase-isomerase QueA [Clostridia bacterium]